MYSVEIKVERDRATGETRVLSTNTTLPVDLSHQGVKVYEDERKGDFSSEIETEPVLPAEPVRTVSGRAAHEYADSTICSFAVRKPVHLSEFQG